MATGIPGRESPRAAFARVAMAVPPDGMAREYSVVWSRLIVVGNEHLDLLEESQAPAPVLIERARQSLPGRGGACSATSTWTPPASRRATFTKRPLGIK